LFLPAAASKTAICYLYSTMHVYLHTEMLQVQQMQLRITRFYSAAETPSPWHQ
jgi:hypothetical protein